MATRGTPHLATGKTWAPACNDEPDAHVLLNHRTPCKNGG